ncbi:MAG TPA: GFA family protein [Burkholderiales bacterium]|nr:GFA family protein [Burkholderiales bacterium]
MRIDGGCHCGRITYEADIDPEKVGVCHCTDCQALSGTAFVAYVQVPKTAFRLRGEPKIYVKTAESGSRRAQAFCPECGTRLYAAAEKDPQVFNLRIGTVRQRASLTPRAQVWCRSALPWVMNLGVVKKHAQQPV